MSTPITTTDAESHLRHRVARLTYELELCQNLLIQLHNHGNLAPDDKVHVQLRIGKLEEVLG